ncbi:MAG: hypothetical protein CMJ94_14225 [Planctomycetes bacterium]|nr:hypothetical protein [Planctomycetota bacterium]
MANQPIDTLRDGSIRAAIWKNEGEKGPFFSVTLTRTFQDEAGNYQDSTSFSGTQLLRVSRLAGRAYDRVGELVAAMREEPR